MVMMMATYSEWWTDQLNILQNEKLYLHLKWYGPFILIKHIFFTHIIMVRGNPVHVLSRISNFGSIC
jgi:hypothetical protein